MPLQHLLHEKTALIKVFNFALEKIPANDLKIDINADKRPAGEYAIRFKAQPKNEVAILLVNQKNEEINSTEEEGQ